MYRQLAREVQRRGRLQPGRRLFRSGTQPWADDHILEPAWRKPARKPRLLAVFRS